jgi:hypothetical protein
MQSLFVILCLFHIAPSSAFDKAVLLPNIDTEPLTRIAFGSCINQSIEQVGDPGWLDALAQTLLLTSKLAHPKGCFLVSSAGS